MSDGSERKSDISVADSGRSEVSDHDGRRLSNAHSTKSASDADQNGNINPEGLITLWDLQHTGPADNEHPEPICLCFDVVVVHGFFGTQRVPWQNPGSGSSAWLDDHKREPFRRVMSFGYDASVLLSGFNTRQCIRELATQLLESLMMARSELERQRPILFLAHDLGGIIVKDALAISNLKPAIYGAISDCACLLLFYACLHRALEYDGLEGKLARFLHRYGQSDSLSTYQIRALAVAVSEINYLFLDSKQAYRSYILSVFSSSETCAVDKAFDNFTSTMGVPFETRIPGNVQDIEIKIKNRIDFVKSSILGIQDSIDDKMLIAAAPPLSSLKTGPSLDHAFAWISDNNCYKSWYNQRRPQLLYLSSERDTQTASEYIFYDLDRLRNENDGEVVIYFTFNRYDIKRDNIQAMLAAALAQILGHFPKIYSEFWKRITTESRAARSFSHEDLLYWIELCKVIGNIGGISFVLNHLDDCELTSRKAFLDRFFYISKNQERPWRVLVTSRQPRMLSDELRTWPELNLDQSAPTTDQNVSTKSYESLSNRYPNMPAFQYEVEKDLRAIRELETSIQELLLQRLIQDEHWPLQRSATDIFGILAELSFESLVAKVLDNISEDFLALQALTWILYAARPLTVWELAAVFKRMKEMNHQSWAFAPTSTADIDLFLRKRLAGIVEFCQGEVLVKTPLIRGAVVAELATKSGKSRLAGSQGLEAAHAIIAAFCVDYLSPTKIIESSEDLWNVSKIADTHISWASDRTSLRDYATRFWLHHLVLSSNALVLAGYSAVDFVQFYETGAATAWFKAYWVLSNPITRYERLFESLYPVLAGAGLTTEAERWCTGDIDVSLALIEACFNGSMRSAQSLLLRIKHTTESLKQALVAALACGSESICVEVISLIYANYSEFPWATQGLLVYRATRRHLRDVLIELLELGCPADEDVFRNLNALRIAVETNNIEGAKILLSYNANPKRIYDQGLTLIHHTAKFGYAEMIQLLADQGVDLNIPADHIGATAIYYTCVCGNFKAAELLVALGVDVNLKAAEDQAKPGWSPLTCAIDLKNLDCARAVLMGNNIDLNSVSVSGTPLHYAVRHGFLEICKHLLNNGVNPNDPPESLPILIEAVESTEYKNKIEILKLLMTKAARIEDEDSKGTTPLLWACARNDDHQRLLIVALLLEHGADVNHSRRDKISPLLFAVWKKDVSLVKLLLKQENVDVNILDASSRTPLIQGLAHEEITKLLLEKGADPNLHPNGTEPALVQAIRDNHEAAVRLLIQHNACIDPPDDHRDYNLWEPMELAVSLGRSDILRILADAGGDVNRQFGTENESLVFKAVGTNALSALLEFRPDVNVQDEDGGAPLHAVTESTSLENIKLLVRAGANINIMNSRKLTPLLVALLVSNEEVASYLIDRGADIKKASDYGGPLHFACESVLVNSVRKLVKLGSDVNEIVSGISGSPLSNLFSNNSTEISTEKRSEILEILLDANADVAALTGLAFGTIGGAATWGGSPEDISKLLSFGTDFTIADTMGRTPLHIAAVRGDLNVFNSVLAAGGISNMRDKCGRSVVSWAAQSGNTDILRTALQLIGDETINEADLSGWTPLCWAARGAGVFNRPSSNQRQIISELLVRRADTTAIIRFRGEEFTPRDIAVYHNCREDVVRALDPSESSSNSGNAQEQRHSGSSHRRRLTDHDESCDFCLFDCWGIRYECKTCVTFSFCYKCYDLKDNIHPKDHIFEAQGEEFVPEDESGTDDDDEIESDAESEGTESTSEDDPDDDSEGHSEDESNNGV
ncbi:ankyrin repeat-containing domain protein [Nemania abortiva]|nr:ankyrin repeat-containing domain protein [Nemania abortiva]